MSKSIFSSSAHWMIQCVSPLRRTAMHPNTMFPPLVFKLQPVHGKDIPTGKIPCLLNNTFQLCWHIGQCRYFFNGRIEFDSRYSLFEIAQVIFFVTWKSKRSYHIFGLGRVAHFVLLIGGGVNYGPSMFLCSFLISGWSLHRWGGSHVGYKIPCILWNITKKLERSINVPPFLFFRLVAREIHQQMGYLWEYKRNLFPLIEELRVHLREIEGSYRQNYKWQENHSLPGDHVLFFLTRTRSRIIRLHFNTWRSRKRC